MNNRIDRLAALLALVATPAVAQAQGNSACLSRTEVNALFINTLPDLIDALGKECAVALPATAYLPSHGALLIKRYRASPTGDWALARSGFIKMMGDKDPTATKMIASLSDETLKNLLGTAFSVALAEKIETKDCQTIDRFVEALSPLPPSNVATIVTELMILGGSEKDGSFNICKES